MGDSGDTVSNHTVAILSSPLYADDNSSALHVDWARIPLPADAAALQRSAALLDAGRDLRPDEARLVSQIARRIAAIIALEPELDVNYRACAEWTWDWQAASAPKPFREGTSSVTPRRRERGRFHAPAMPISCSPGCSHNSGTCSRRRCGP